MLLSGSPNFFLRWPRCTYPHNVVLAYSKQAPMTLNFAGRIMMDQQNFHQCMSFKFGEWKCRAVQSILQSRKITLLVGFVIITPTSLAPRMLLTYCQHNRTDLCCKSIHHTKHGPHHQKTQRPSPSSPSSTVQCTVETEHRYQSMSTHIEQKLTGVHQWGTTLTSQHNIYSHIEMSSIPHFTQLKWSVCNLSYPH